MLNWDSLPDSFRQIIKRDNKSGFPLSLDSNFIKRYRKDIEKHLFANNSVVLDVANTLRQKGIGKSVEQLRTESDALTYLSTCKCSRSLIQEYKKAINRITKGTIKMHKSPFSVDLTIAPEPMEKPFDFQKNAIESLTVELGNNMYNEKLGWQPALLVMPTGSGKTNTATWFVLFELIKKGYKVLWLAHRNLLLEQAAGKAKYYAKICQSDIIKRLNCRIVSGQHSIPSTATFMTDDIIYMSINTLGRNFDRLEFILQGISDNKLCVVVDEAHHIPMFTYRETLRLIKEKVPGFKLLGMTATPTRMIWAEHKAMNYFFDSKYISKITMSELISKGFLATPVSERVSTDIDMTYSLSDEDKKYIDTFHDISPELAEKIANAKPRNEKITKQYLDNKDRYGKTLIFALNQIHAETLAKLLQSKGVKADYVISDESDYKNDVIERFRDNNHPEHIDVLVNVQILTEGADIPDIQTVFLTRPTQSHSLLMQMIGRAMRGKEMGGTEIAYIVDFYDSWGTVQKWLNPQFELDAELRITNADPNPPQDPKVPVLWSIINDIHDHIVASQFSLSSNMSIPLGWFSVNYDDKYGRISKTLIFDNTKEGYDRIKKDIDNIKNSRISPREALNKYFVDTISPLPTLREINSVLNYIEKNGKFPEFFDFDERNAIDPSKYAKEIIENNFRLMEQQKYIEKTYNDISIIQQIYTDIDNFSDIVNKRIQDIIRGKTQEQVPEYFEPVKSQLSQNPAHDLEKVYNDVVKLMFQGQLQKPDYIGWTEKPIKNAWGYYRFEDRKLLINKLLDSTDVPKEVIEFLVYHELIHALGKREHDRSFRDAEHKFPNYQQWDNFLDCFFEKFSIS